MYGRYWEKAPINCEFTTSYVMGDQHGLLNNFVMPIKAVISNENKSCKHLVYITCRNLSGTKEGLSPSQGALVTS